MQHDLNDIFAQAVAHRPTVIIKGEGYVSGMIIGCKITKDIRKGSIQIQATSYGGDYYKDITDEEYNIFVESGWVIGSYHVQLSVYRKKLDTIALIIRNEIAGPNREAKIQQLKRSRELMLSLYNAVSRRLIKI